MSKRTLFGVGVTLLVIGMVLSAFTVQPVYSIDDQPCPADLKMDRKLKELIDDYAEDYHHEFWDVSLSQYKAWIALTSLREAGNGRYAAHSQYGGGYDGDRFNHVAVGYKFRFSTGIGAFQLDRGGFQGDANENWGTMPTIEKLDPEKSLMSTLRWHRDRYGDSTKWTGVTLADFSANSPWFAVQQDKVSGFNCQWKQITGFDWDETKDKKMDVDFDPPVLDDPFERSVEHVGQVWWDIPKEGWKGFLDTWLIHPRSWAGNIVTERGYYYTYREDIGWEMWVWNDPNDKYIYRFARNYKAGPFPEGRKDTGGEVAVAGVIDNTPALDPTRSIYRSILFDDTHDTDGDELTGPQANYRKLSEVLQKEDYVIEELDVGPVTYDILEDYGIFILPDVELELSRDEVKDMTKYLNGGGRVLIIGEWKGAHLPGSVTKLSGVAGIRFDDTIVYDEDDNHQHPYWPIIHNIDVSHGIGKGISKFAMYRGSSLILTDPGRAKAIARGDSNTYVEDPVGDGTLPDSGKEDAESLSEPHSSVIIVLAASSYPVSGGQARLVCTGDSDLWKTQTEWEWNDYDPIEDYDNKKLLLNVVDWLATPMSPPATPPPGFGIVSQGEVITSSVNIVEGAPELRVELSWPGSDLDLGVEDPLGRYVGYNPETGQVEAGVHGAEYSGIDAKPEWVRIPNPEPGDWNINVYAREATQEYELYRVDVPDTFPPAAITDLTALDYTLNSILLTWTSPGDDGNRGTASAYDIRYSTEPITEDNWSDALQCEGEPTPQQAGVSETFTITGLAPGTTYYFAAKSSDKVPNWSALSNIAKGATWTHIFEDSGRGTKISINTNEKTFQMITPDKDYGVRKATYMRVHHRMVKILHKDSELKLITHAKGGTDDFCIAVAWDRQTRKRYQLMDKHGVED